MHTTCVFKHGLIAGILKFDFVQEIWLVCTYTHGVLGLKCSSLSYTLRLVGSPGRQSRQMIEHWSLMMDGNNQLQPRAHHYTEYAYTIAWLSQESGRMGRNAQVCTGWRPPAVTENANPIRGYKRQDTILDKCTALWGKPCIVLQALHVQFL